MLLSCCWIPHTVVPQITMLCLWTIYFANRSFWQKFVKLLFYFMQTLHQVMNTTSVIFPSWPWTWPSFPESWNELRSWTEVALYFLCCLTGGPAMCIHFFELLAMLALLSMLSLRNFCIAYLVSMKFLKCSLSWKYFVFSLILKESFTGYISQV